MKILTPTQKIVLQRVKALFAKNGRMPTIRELRDDLLGIGLRTNSPRSVFLHLQALEEAGYLNRQRKKKGIRLPSWQGFLNVPIYGAANAGTPTIFADQEVEGYLRILKTEVNSDRIFAIRISGDSMNKEKISDGDYVLVNPTIKNFHNSDKVLAIIDTLATVKIFTKVNDELIKLSPNSSNKIHKPIFIRSEDDFVINGKVVGVFKGSIK